MNNTKIYCDQALSDLMELRKDVEGGLYEKNPKGFLEEIDRITEKINDASSQAEEEERSAARCPKCGDRVLGDEDGLCGNCV